MKIIIHLLLVGMCFIYFDVSDALHADGSSIPTQTSSLPTDVAVLPVQALPGLSLATHSRVIEEYGTPMGEKKFVIGKRFLPPGPRPDT